MTSKLLPRRDTTVGRIIVPVTILNQQQPEKELKCKALVDTGASHLVLPRAWKDLLGSLETTRTVEVETADQTLVEGEMCGPVRVQIQGFKPIHTEIMFIEMQPSNNDYEPLLGYIPLEQSQAAVDMVRHRLVHVKHLDLK